MGTGVVVVGAGLAGAAGCTPVRTGHQIDTCALLVSEPGGIRSSHG